MLGAKIVLALVFISVAFASVLVNLWISDRTAPAFAWPPRLTTWCSGSTRWSATVGGWCASRCRSCSRGLGTGAASQWNDWILFTHRVEFGKTDAMFGRDLGFYVFQLPFWDFLVSWLFAALVVTLLVTLVNDYFNGSIQAQAPEGTRLSERFSQRVKVHAASCSC